MTDSRVSRNDPLVEQAGEEIAKSETAAVADILEVERCWVQAHRDLDLATLEEILDDEYLQIRSDGSLMGKPEALESYRSGKRTWDLARSDDYRISIHGRTAILIGRWRGRGSNEGIPFDYTARFLSVYRNAGGRWKLLAEQSTPLTG